jgi:penicillin-binding protein 1C
MAAAHALTDERLREALGERLSLHPRAGAFSAPHFVEMVRSNAGDRPPARIVTTLDLDLQRQVEGIIEHERPSLTAHGAANVSVVVLDNARGEWLAWEGSGNYADGAHGGSINGPLVPRQPGSALKPFTYALAFEQGRDPASVLPDIPSHFPTREPGVLYSPRNYDGQYRGPLLARRALAGSENVPAVALVADVGVSTLLRFFDRAGLSTFDRTSSYYGLGVTLGNAEVRLDQLVAAYAAFARGGVWQEARSLLPPEGGSYETDGGGGGSAALRSRRFRLQPEDPVREAHRIVSARTAFWITDILSDPEARAFVFGRGSNLEFPFPVAVKTGTSQAYHDNWIVGYTRDVTIGVWVGNFDRTPLRNSSGVTGAGPIFHAVMLAATHGRESAAATAGILAPPAGTEQVTICALSGMRANAWCPSRAKEWIGAGDAETLPCSWHHQDHRGLLTIYPPEYRAWAESDRSEPVRRAMAATASTARAAAPLTISNPPAGAIYSVDPTLRREFQALPLRAVAPRPTLVTWMVDGEMVGTASSERALSWPLAVGAHEIEARDTDGRRARTSVIVK